MDTALIRAENSTIGRSILSLLSRVSPSTFGGYAAEAFGHPGPRPGGPLVPETANLAPHRFTVTVEPYDLAVWDWGEGPTVLLVHGWNGQAAQLSRFVAPLVAAGFNVIAFDQPAHNLSTGSYVNVVEMARAVEGVADHVRPIHGVIGHSLGATAAALAIARGLELERAVLIAPPAEPVYFARAFARWLGATSAATDAMIAQLQRRVGPLESLDLRRLAPSLDVPMLLLHDPQDREVPFAHGKAIAEAWPGARLEVLRGRGHRRMLADPRVIDMVVDFVRGPDAVLLERKSA
jgi:pimeloyl-ACP methyl ester carboxylesterase